MTVATPRTPSVLLLSLLLISLAATPAVAQDDATPAIKRIPAPPAASNAAGCELGAAEVDLDVSSVRARLYNIGGLFWRGASAVYEVPAGSGATAVFSAGLWIGGLYDGNPADVRFAGATYRNWEFWPGPLDADGATTPDRCAAFDRIWSIRQSDVDAFDAGEAPTNDLAQWPIAQGAPFYTDANGNGLRDASEPVTELDLGDPGYSTELDAGRQIDLIRGERPLVYGSQTAWWIMNDAGATHGFSQLPALGVEVRVQAFAVSDGASVALDRATFYRYTVTSRAEAPLTDVRIGMWNDADLGDYWDDYAATDPGRSMYIVYNGDHDDSGPGGYGLAPPALGFDVLSGADGAHAMVKQGGPRGEPSAGEGLEAYGYLHSVWKDGTPLTRGGTGYNPRTDSARVYWSYPNDPVRREYWTEEDPGREGRPNTPQDGRGVIYAVAGTLAPGASATFDLAIVFSAGEARLQSVEALRRDSDAVQALYDAGELFAAARASGPAPGLPPSPPAPASAPSLLAPADGTVFGPDEPTVSLSWTPVEGAAYYLIETGDTEEFESPQFYTVDVSAPSAVLSWIDRNPFTGRAFWRVRAVNRSGLGPHSAIGAFTYLYYDYSPRVLRLFDGTRAYVEIANADGTDPCGPEAQSTSGCDWILGNPVDRSLNSTGAYYLSESAEGSDAGFAEYAPRDFEIRFSTSGGYASYGTQPPYNSIRVPFEVWDIGVVAPGEANDPSDDVRLIPYLFADGGGTCAFDYGEADDPTFGFPATDQIYAYYPAEGESYDSYAAAVGPLVDAAPEECAPSPGGDGEDVRSFRGGDAVVRGSVFAQFDAEVGIGDLTGTVIRMYTTDPMPPVAREAGVDGGALELATHPNPTTGRATVAFTLAGPSEVRVRLLDVLGREVAVLADGAHAAGRHELALDAARLAAGLYVVRVEAGDATGTRRITVVR